MEEKAILVPYDKIPSEALTGLMKSFIEREGTDYGATELSEEAKLGRLRKSLEKGLAFICFEENTESFHILSKKEAREKGLL